MRGKKVPVCILLAAAAIVVCAALWYTRPMPLSQIYPQLPLETCQSITLSYEVYTGAEDGQVQKETLTLLPGDDRFAAVLDLFASRAFRRDLTALLPGAVQTHTPRAGDFRWDIFFTFPQIPLSDGSVVSGELLYCENFFGRVRLSFDGNEIAVTGAQKEAWTAEVLAAGRGG